ncbi:MAG: cystathionine gamma-synthase, partial [Myxococcaceae bacterium]|nr:cystathionine gamma-synthase [Myxococcaceae bacterium]
RLYDYTRSGNPTRDLLGCALAELEEGEGAVVTSTGTSAVLLAVSVLRPDDLLVAPHDCYGGTFRLFTALAERGHFRVTFVDLTDEAQLAEALEQKPALLWVETPSNPLLRITDLRDVTTTAHRVGARVVVDNTFLSPALQKPIALGADVVVHSTTKYINGHSDVVGGALVAREAAVHQEYAWWANCLGVTGAPFDSYLTLRGLRTLHARFRVHEENARAVAELLRAHPAVERVFYPGLEEHPGHALAASQQRGFGGMVSFELRGGTEAVRAYLQGLRHFSLAESLGGVESLVAHPATMTHASMTPEARARAGIRDSLLRLSIGIEAAEDLVADVAAGLERAERSTEVRAIRAVR